MQSPVTRAGSERSACVGAAPLMIASSFQLTLPSVQAAFRRTYLSRIFSSYRSYRCDQVSFYRFYGTSPALLLARAPPTTLTLDCLRLFGSGFCARPARMKQPVGFASDNSTSLSGSGLFLFENSGVRGLLNSIECGGTHPADTDTPYAS